MSAAALPRFAWTGRSTEGAVQGEVEATDAGAAARSLSERGITPLTIKPAGTAGPSGPAAGAGAQDLGAAWRRRFPPRIDPTERMLLTRQLYTLLRAGVPILRALAGLQESATHPVLKSTLGAVRHSLESGIALSGCLAQHPRVFDTFYVALVRVGEMTGRLDEVFLRLFHHQEFEMLMGQQVKSALRYPSFVVAAMVGAIGVINLMVIPAFANVFKMAGSQLPLATRLLMGTSRFTIDYGWALLAAGVLGALALRRWIATPAGRLRWDRFMLDVPVAGKIVRKSMLARFARSFALSLKSGVPLTQALAVVSQTVDNAFISARVDTMRETVTRGETVLRAAAATGVFTPIVLQMIAVGEETGALDEMMDEVAGLYTNEVQYELKTLSQQIEPILVSFLGALVLILALGVFLPVWDLGSTAMKR